MVGVCKFKSHVLVIVEVKDHDPVDAVVAGDKFVSGKIKLIIFRKTKIKIHRKIKMGQVWISTQVII